jgi:hypothetical protein
MRAQAEAVSEICAQKVVKVLCMTTFERCAASVSHPASPYQVWFSEVFSSMKTDIMQNSVAPDLEGEVPLALAAPCSETNKPAQAAVSTLLHQ